jgi:hypothetical protein
MTTMHLELREEISSYVSRMFSIVIKRAGSRWLLRRTLARCLH